MSSGEGGMSGIHRVSKVTGTVVALVAIAVGLFTIDSVYSASRDEAQGAVYARGVLRVNLPYHAERAGIGQFTLEVLDPEDKVLGQTQRQLRVHEGNGFWRDEVRLTSSLAAEELVWQRLRYRFTYDDKNIQPLEHTESVSRLLRTPVVHIIGQQAYLAGGSAAVRVIVTDSQNQVIRGGGAVRIELAMANQRDRLLFRGELNNRGTTEAQFNLPAGVVGAGQLRYVVDTPIGSTEFNESVRVDDKAAILLSTEKPIYQPGQDIHVRALALDRANHQAVAGRTLTFEIEDSRGNKVFKRATQTDKFGIASAEFRLADEVNLGTYHLRALMGDAEAPTNTAEVALTIQKYVLPKFKVAIDFGKTKRQHGYRPGDHVTGTVHANYFFGKPVQDAGVSIKASGMDVSLFDAGSVSGKTNEQGEYRFDLRLANYFVGRPLNHGTARILIEATVKDSAAHSETRGEGITVSQSPLLITAVPEGGALAPNLENQVFILTSYPDGAPAQTTLQVSLGGTEQRAMTDEAGVAVVTVKAAAGSNNIGIRATDKEDNVAAIAFPLESRPGEEQVLLRSERAVYRAGDRMNLKVLSTKKRGTAYIDIVKEGQTVLTRDVDFENGQAELSLTATPELTGMVDVNAYLFGTDARPVGDHRLLFVQPADELKIQTSTDATVYKPGEDARVRFRVTDSRGQGVSAAIGLQVVDEAVFALAEKQPGFAKVFFYLEQEVMKPRFEIHSIGMPDVVEPDEKSKVEERDRAARALFSATELVNDNKFETEFGRNVGAQKYAEYAQRYQAAFVAEVERLAERLNDIESHKKDVDLIQEFGKLDAAGKPETRDAWGNKLRVENVTWYRDKWHYIVRSVGPDGQANSGDDMIAMLEVRQKHVVNPATRAGRILVDVEHDRGPFNQLAEITGTVSDESGASITNAKVEIRETGTAKVRWARTNNAGQFKFSGIPAGEYAVQVLSPGFATSSLARVKIMARDRAVLSATLDVGSVSETVEVQSAAPMMVMKADVAGGAMGGVVRERMMMEDRAFAVAQNVAMPAASPVSRDSLTVVRNEKEKKDESSTTARVRSYFPEALYINPEIVTDGDGRASISIPLADSITTWRIAMLASTTRGALGSSASSLKVFQDFFIDLDLPVTLTQGDRVSIPVAVYNYSGSKGQVGLKLAREDWFDLTNNDGEKSLSVEAGRVGGSEFAIEAKRIGKFKLTLSAQMNGTEKRADIVVREIEVIPNGREQSLVFNGRLESSVHQNVEFPPNAIDDASKIFVRLYPGPLSQVVEGMDKLLQMPFGCFEQTSSSTYPNVLALDYMKRTKKLTPEVHAKAEGYIANGYQRLLTFEVPGGGFSWFGNAPANKILTAYGLMEFSDMSKVHDVDPRLITRTQQWLAGQQQADGSWNPDQSFINEGATNRYNKDLLRITAYLGWALENTGYDGPAVAKAREYVMNHLGEKADSYTLAVIANFAVDSGKDREFARRAIQKLADAREEKDDQVWWTSEETGVYSTGQSASIETTGLAVQALLKFGEENAISRKALSYIAAKKDASGTWGTTQATIMALRALLLASEENGADVHGTAEVLLNGQVVSKLALTPENNDLLHQFVFKVQNSEKPSEIEMRFEGKGVLAYQVVGSYFLPWDQKPTNEALSIEVDYDRTHLIQDDTVSATATIKNNLDKTANMVMVDLGIPPGFDLLSEDLQTYVEKSVGLKSGRLEKFSQTATQAILYFDSFAPGDTVHLQFRLHAKYPIRARTFRSRVYEYYDPSVGSDAKPIQLEVRNR